MQQLDLFAAPPAPAHTAIAPSRPWVRDWNIERAAIDAALQRNAAEVLRWGKSKGKRGDFYQIELLRDGDLWRVRYDYDIGSGGGGGPFGPAVHKSRDEALIAKLRQLLRRCAQHLAGCWSSEDEPAWKSLAAWCIATAPPVLFGGADLRPEFDAACVEEAAKEVRRRAVLMAAHLVEKQAVVALQGLHCGGLDLLLVYPPYDQPAPDMEWGDRFFGEFHVTGSVDALALVIYPRATATPELLQRALDALATVEGAEVRLCTDDERSLCVSDRKALRY